ncbi:MAG: metallophosphoesterase [Candidatus Omnitrophica bacterium]|nr:metallophosphoesterase [Candidatus Omnitrophota bacterium]
MTKFGLLKLGFLTFAFIGGILMARNLLVRRKWSFVTKLFAVGIIMGTIFFVDIYIIEPNWIDVHKVKVEDARLHQILGNTKLVHITDIHLNSGLGFREEQLIKKVNRLKPDLIFMTGDFIDNLTQVDDARELISQLKASVGIYGVPGNTDHLVMDGKSLARELKSSGIDILVNESRRIRLPNGNILWIAGVDDPKYRYARIDKTMMGVPEDVPVIMLAHAPSAFQAAAESDVNLLLVGDTHGGQVGIPFLVQLSDYANRTPYVSGLFEMSDTQMYVNRGIGMKTLPIRFLCRPEISVIEVTSDM